LLNTDFSGVKNAEHPQLEECLFRWFPEQREDFIPINDEMLILKAKDFGSPEYFGVRDLVFSVGWLSGFMLPFANEERFCYFWTII
jgi:hypothetical protein